MQTRKWQNQQGQDQYTTEIVIDQKGVMQMLGRPSGNNQGSTQQNNGYGQQQYGQGQQQYQSQHQAQPQQSVPAMQQSHPATNQQQVQQQPMQQQPMQNGDDWDDQIPF